MTTLENYLSIINYGGYDYMPTELNFCPLIEQKYRDNVGGDMHYLDYFDIPVRNVAEDDIPKVRSFDEFSRYVKKEDYPEDTYINGLALMFEPSKDNTHYNHQRYMLAACEELDEIKEFEIITLQKNRLDFLRENVDNLHSKGHVARGHMGATIWETAWGLRGMEELMVDMLCNENIALEIFDKVTELSLQRAADFAKAGCDVIWLGDDIGTQHSTLMSEQMYTEWIKPRLKAVINTIKGINPNIKVFYHSCGYVEPFIPHLIEAGIDVLNPIQPECMDFEKIYSTYKGSVAFHGSIGTQTTFPFGSAKEVYDKVIENLDIAGKNGGLLIAPTHMLQPEVPWENIVAYTKACYDYNRR